MKADSGTGTSAAAGVSTISAPLIFGTDGIRDRAGCGLLREEAIERFVAAVAHVVLTAGGGPRAAGEPCRAALVGRDTRRSGEAILRIVERAFTRRGFDVVDAGVLTTPGVAFAGSVHPEVALSVVISASHNPAEYNGIKLFAADGAKVTEAFERSVSDAFHAGVDPRPQRRGAIRREAEAALAAYVDHLVGCSRRPDRIAGTRLALDTANGAAYRVAPAVFRRLGGVVSTVGDAPDGTNINDHCGALHPENVARLVTACGGAIGFSFDGDGDRMVPVGAQGTIFDGDHVLFLTALARHATGTLPGDTVVATSMSNLGLETALAARGILLARTDVGDRNVYREMVRRGFTLGGEQSGHTIFLDDARTGDGILSALRLIDSLPTDDLDLEKAAAEVPRFPQRIENVRVSAKPPLESLPAVARALEDALAQLDGRGRIVLRYSGTEPLARVMVESDDVETTARVARAVARAIAGEVGAGGP